MSTASASPQDSVGYRLEPRVARAFARFSGGFWTDEGATRAWLLTLGLFLFVINALMFWAAASVLEGLHVNGFWAAMVGSLLYSLCALVIDMAMEALFSRREG